MAKAKPVWKTIDDAKVRHVWAKADGTGEITVDPAFYAENGTPIVGDESEDGDSGEDMVYVRTEVLA